MEIISFILMLLHLAAAAVVIVVSLKQLPSVAQKAAIVPNWVFHGITVMFLTLILGVVVESVGAGAGIRQAGVIAQLAVLVAMSLIAVVNRRKRGVSGGVLGMLAALAAISAVLLLLP